MGRYEAPTRSEQRADRAITVGDEEGREEVLLSPATMRVVESQTRHDDGSNQPNLRACLMAKKPASLQAFADLA